MSVLMELHTMMPLALFDVGSMFVIAILAVLLFGGELPQMARKFGKYYSDFNRTVGAFKREVSSVVNDITTEVNDTPSVGSSHSSGSSALRSEKNVSVDDDVEIVAPKFEPPKK